MVLSTWYARPLLLILLPVNEAHFRLISSNTQDQFYSRPSEALYNTISCQLRLFYSRFYLNKPTDFQLDSNLVIVAIRAVLSY